MWKFCCSLKLAILLASLATFLLMGGSLLFPGNPQLFGPLDSIPLGRWLNDFAAKAPTLSWWFYCFILTMALLLLNTICCFFDWLFNIHLRWRKSGEYLIHLGVILLLIGFGWGASGGWRHIALPCTVGELTPLPNWPGHYVAVDSFQPIMTDSGQPADMISQVRLLAGDQRILAGEVRINQPLLENGLVITPASFGRAPVGFSFLIDGKRVNLKAGDRLKQADGSRLDVLRFLPDARFDKNGQLRYRTDRVGSPAMELDFSTPDGKRWRGWYFLAQPAPEALSSLQPRPLQPLYTSYSSLTINYDPGSQVSATGGILTALGCLLALISFYRKRNRQDRPEI
jgi:cytochrome c biogenesis protein